MKDHPATSLVVHCAGAVAAPRPDFDALANSFAALSVAIAIGASLVGLLSIVVTVAWNRTTKVSAVQAAREAAEGAALDFMRGEGIERVQRHVAAQMTADGPVEPGIGIAAGTSTGTGVAGPAA